MFSILDFLVKHWSLTMGIVVTGLLLLREEIRSRLFSKHVLSPEDAALESRKGRIITDIRDKTDFIAEHVDGADWLKIDTLQKKPERIIKPEKSYIIYCSDGAKSSEVAMFLRQKHGFKVSCIEGGLAAWKAHGFATISGSKPA